MDTKLVAAKSRGLAGLILFMTIVFNFIEERRLIAIVKAWTTSRDSWFNKYTNVGWQL